MLKNVCLIFPFVTTYIDFMQDPFLVLYAIVIFRRKINIFDEKNKILIIFDINVSILLDFYTF